MKKSILVDAVHSEETRVLVLLENSIEELDFESATKAQHKGNIYKYFSSILNNNIYYVL